MRKLDTGSLAHTPAVMGVVNVTPDSFSDGGRFVGSTDRVNVDAALAEAEAMVKAGASIIDIGGESTRPGAVAVGAQQEMDRVLPVLERVVAELDCVASVDTSNAALMQEAVRVGAGMLNDVRSFRRPGALEVAAQCELPLCIMHMQGEPGNMQEQPEYHDVVAQVHGFLEQRLQALEDARVCRARVIVDPGFGFGKTLQHNLALLANLDQLHSLGCPVLVGLSRKSMFGQLLERPVDQRLYGGLAAAAIAVMNGAGIVRTHDVAATLDAVKFAWAVRLAKHCGQSKDLPETGSAVRE